jgi:predicted nuclease of predicted toxin-antitoxin system
VRFLVDKLVRFLVDKNVGPSVANWLRGQSHEVFSVYEAARGMDDDRIIQKAFADDWILITSDKDFGEKIYREQWPHRGVVLLRLKDERVTSKIATLQRLLENHLDHLADAFMVVTENRVRFARRSEVLHQS